MATSGLDYQKRLLRETVEEAADQCVIEEATAEAVRDEIDDADTSADIDRCWGTVEREHSIISQLS